VSPSTVSQTSVPTVRVSASTASHIERSTSANRSTPTASAPAASATDGTSGPVGGTAGRRFVVMSTWWHGGVTSTGRAGARTGGKRAPAAVVPVTRPASQRTATARDDGDVLLVAWHVGVVVLHLVWPGLTEG
jgi:hypothetical protein